MRMIETEEQIEKKVLRNKRIGSIFIIGLLVFSSLGFAYFSGDRNQSSDSQNQINNPYGLIELQRGQEVFYFTNTPEIFSQVPVELNKNYVDYQGREIFLDIGNEFVSQEISLNLKRYASRMQRACYGNCEEDLPELGCDKDVIIYKYAETDRVYSQDNCVFIEGSLRAVDAFIYKLFNLG